MKDFMSYNCNITKIHIACFVPPGFGDKVHKNRKFHGLAFHLTGNKTYIFSDGRRIHINAGDIIYLPKSSSYEVISEQSGNCYAINFDIDEDTDFAPFAIHTTNQTDIQQLYKQTVKAWTLKNKGYIEKCKAELYSILHILIAEYWKEYTPSKKHELISKGVDYIHSNYLTEIISIQTVSELCEITPEYFRRTFKQIYGVSPIKYINKLKINHARDLIESQMYSISEAAFQSGYSDISHFSREFKKATGYSPSEYIQKMLKSI